MDDLQNMALTYCSYDLLVLRMWVVGTLEKCGAMEHAVVVNDKYCCLEPGAGQHDSRLMSQAALINSQQH